MQHHLRLHVLEYLGQLVALEDVGCEIGRRCVSIALSVCVDDDNLGGWACASKFSDEMVS